MFKTLNYGETVEYESVISNSKGCFVRFDGSTEFICSLGNREAINLLSYAQVQLACDLLSTSWIETHEDNHLCHDMENYYIVDGYEFFAEECVMMPQFNAECGQWRVALINTLGQRIYLDEDSQEFHFISSPDLQVIEDYWDCEGKTIIAHEDLMSCRFIDYFGELINTQTNSA